MKKVVIGGVLLLSLLLGACGNTESSSGDSASSTKEKTAESSTAVQLETSTTNSQIETSTSEAASNVGFKDGVATLEDIDVKITKHAVIQPGEAGNEYGDSSVIAFWYDTTNKTGKEIDPTTAWMIVFKALQDNDPNMENELQIASLPDSQYLNTQTNNIKQGGTVSNAVAYTLTDTTTPVTLIANQGLMGEELGRQDYAIQ
ncbi:hypothetical protein A5844_000744 [Enterococcus sp. 10A9_DIV0425]|uniref:DUF5067 domain-containing protein n=1 Tax=Candidatus Enterococcus wittei TaxID=1987383 RepID=A0A2C9XQT0_9ENTE|nr:DUF5067 domain-containing protein [Enterococcus sp. 10A9_DIV0425]OTP12511.1 hypothetical protein A5844_000744 [Enterococcus sp. 10A9_DIV0425]